MNEPNWMIGLGALFLTVITMQASFGAWISNQFNKVRSSVDKIREDIISKLEYHEQHDDRRFGELRDDVWEIRLRLATLDKPRTEWHELRPPSNNSLLKEKREDC